VIESLVIAALLPLRIGRLSKFERAVIAMDQRFASKKMVMAKEKDQLIKVPPSAAATRLVQHRVRDDGAGHPLNRGCGNELDHLKYWHLEHEAIFPRCQSVSRAGNGGLFPVPRDCRGYKRRS
jgi:hypothetical protein